MRRLSPVQAVLSGTLVVGVLDITDALVFFGLRGASYVVVPLSAAGGRGGSPPLPVLVNGLLIHAFGVGLPSALFARAAAPRRP